MIMHAIDEGAPVVYSVIMLRILYPVHAGPVHLMKGSIASSCRESRHAKKRSFEQSMSATAAKILKMEQERGGEKTIDQGSGREVLYMYV